MQQLLIPSNSATSLNAATTAHDKADSSMVAHVYMTEKRISNVVMHYSLCMSIADRYRYTSDRMLDNADLTQHQSNTSLISKFVPFNKLSRQKHTWVTELLAAATWPKKPSLDSLSANFAQATWETSRKSWEKMHDFTSLWILAGLLRSLCAVAKLKSWRDFHRCT